MSPVDEEKTAFMTDYSNFCYKVLPFELKNAGAAYQHLMDRNFQEVIDQAIEVYVDDTIVKAETNEAHLDNLSKVFQLLKEHNLRLNPDKCSFGVQAGEFLGYVLTHRGIEANPVKCRAIIDMKSPKDAKEVHILTGRIVALSHFIARSAAKIRPLFQLLRKNTSFQWSEECEQAF